MCVCACVFVCLCACVYVRVRASVRASACSRVTPAPRPRRSAVLGANALVPIARGALEPRLNTLIENLRRWRGESVPPLGGVRSATVTISLGERAVSMQMEDH